MNTVTIHGRVFRLSADTDEGQSSTFAWEGVTPMCPDCIAKRGTATPLVNEKKNIPMTHEWAGESRVQCEACGWKSELIK